jgi:hypothetical protein
MLAEPGATTNPITVQLVSATIADALTARFGGRVNQRDHAALPRTLRTAFGNRLPMSRLPAGSSGCNAGVARRPAGAQERRLVRLLERKDEVRYGPRWGSLIEATSLSAELEGLAV